MTPSAVSKLIARLEARLGARLLTRSTRTLQLTPEGAAFHERATHILAALDEAERVAAAGERPVGRVRVSTSASFGIHVLAPLVPGFLALHPGVTLDIAHTDEVIDLLAERTDVAVRAGPLTSSRLGARKLGATGMKLVAAPSYLERAGLPTTVDELEGHERLGLAYARSIEGWPFVVKGEAVTVAPAARVQASDGEALRHLALAGAGLARLATFTIRQDLRAGHLVELLEAHNPRDREAFHAIYVGQGGPLPARVRALLDFLAARARVR